ncbi:WD repeat-containing protein 62 [Phlyctema vagabunda]|uniref:WD repeat-containing protein 62 n=1 Tax=Phlyctema vagabunda TaxID=108571 RepID=A0ABR4PFW0_9HELO
MASSTPSNPRTFTANTGLGLKLTPSNSPYSRNPRSPGRKSLYDSTLSLQRIIGTTVSSPAAFDTLPSAEIFAYCAGAAAVVVNVHEATDDAPRRHSQRFFRARPTATALATVPTASYAPSTPTNQYSNTANDSRNRSNASLRDTAIPYSPTVSHTHLDWGDSSPKTWTSRERIKAATCVSLSRDGRLLAVGETGYSPRVLVFSLLENSSDAPLAILNEHTYGVRAVAFSPDNYYLASLGSPNDGFLYVWSVKGNLTKLHSSNKCTSFVKQMIWMGNKNIVTIGTRHIKVWRIEESQTPSPTKTKFALDGTPQPASVQSALKPLAGRNCLLGPLVEATFNCIDAISEQRAIVCSEKGDVCLLDDADGLKLTKLFNVGFPVACLAVNTELNSLRIGGRTGIVKVFDLEEVLTSLTVPSLPTLHLESNGSHLCAMGYAGQSLVTVDSKHLIEIVTPTSHEESDIRQIQIPAHGDSVMGVCLLSSMNSLKADFITWSADGIIVFWDLNGMSKLSISAEIEQLATGDEEQANQCQIVRASDGVKFLVVGDRYGVLKIMEPETETCLLDSKAHSGEIQDIALFEDSDSTLIASCGRDRTVQLFRRNEKTWSLMQTMDDHSSSVCKVSFAENGEKLISCSTGREIHIRQLVKKNVSGDDVVAAVPFRIITLKASPVSMAISAPDARTTSFVVSMLDRTVATYDLATGRLVSSFRATDNDGTEAVVLDALVMGKQSILPGRPAILAGVSGTDKSVRIYDANTGAFLDREWGHTAAVTGVALVENPDSDQKILISTGLDGTIMLWDLSPKTPGLQEPVEPLNGDEPPKEATSARPPLRRVLSKAELAEFQRSSPLSTPSGRSSPPRVVRRKTSRYGLSSQSSLNATPPLPSQHYSSVSEDSALKSRGSPRNRSRSPPPSPRGKETRRPSVASLESRSRNKPSAPSTEFGTLNMATEQACRTLRAYRKKLLSSDSVKESSLRELDHELRLTAMALGEKSLKAKAISETVLSELLERIELMFDEKLRLTRLVPEPGLVPEPELEMESNNTNNKAVAFTADVIQASSSQ